MPDRKRPAPARDDVVTGAAYRDKLLRKTLPPGASAAEFERIRRVLDDVIGVGVVIDRRPVRDAPQPAAEAPSVNEVPVDETPAHIGHYLHALMQFDDVLARLASFDREEIMTGWREDKLGELQRRALLGLGRLLGIEIDLSRIPGYEGSSTHEPPVVKPEEQKKLLPAHQVSALYGIPVGALKIAVGADGISLDADAAARVAAGYKRLLSDRETADATLRDELGLSFVEIAATKQAVKSELAHRQGSRKWEKEHPLDEAGKEAYNARKQVDNKRYRAKARGEIVSPER